MQIFEEILNDNNLYIEENKTCLKTKANKLNEFMKIYKKANDSRNNPFTPTIKRSNNGLLLLDDEPFLVSNLKSSRNCDNFWILLSNGSRIFLKKDNPLITELELLYMYLAKELEISCANYDVCYYDGNTYTASNSFLGLNDTLVDYYNLEFLFKNMTNYTGLEKIRTIEISKLQKLSKKINGENHLLKTLFLDEITNHYDRFPHNFKVIKNEILTSAPLFDNGGCCNQCEKLKYQRPSVNDSHKKQDIISYLLDFEIIKEVYQEKKDKIDVLHLANLIYKEKNIVIGKEAASLFGSVLNESKKLITNTKKYH